MSQRAFLGTLAAGLVLLLVLAWTSVAKGSTPLPLPQILSALAGRWAPDLQLPEVGLTLQRIVWDLRVPRVLLRLSPLDGHCFAARQPAGRFHRRAPAAAPAS